MMVFDLQCPCSCQFEGWFASRDDFERQRAAKLIACPTCGSCAVDKILSPVAYHSASSASNPGRLDDEGGAQEDGDAVLQLLDAVQEIVEKNFEDVGSKLAEESLKIHYGIKPARNIRGVTTEEQEKVLADEGIQLLKVPVVKKPGNSKLN